MSQSSRNSFEGLCIGGPRDKHHVCASTPIVRFNLPPPFRQSPRTLPEYKAPDHFDYQHVTFDFAEEGESGSTNNGITYGFWVSNSERHPRRFVLETLAAAYGVNHG